MLPDNVEGHQWAAAPARVAEEVPGIEATRVFGLAVSVGQHGGRSMSHGRLILRARGPPNERLQQTPAGAIMKRRR